MYILFHKIEMDKQSNIKSNKKLFIYLSMTLIWTIIKVVRFYCVEKIIKN